MSAVVGPRVSKVVIAGPVGVGKTTAVAAASDAPALRTEARPSDEVRALKATTTVGIDFGVMRLDARHAVHLYGTPGQERFEFMWSIVTEGSKGLVLLVDAAEPCPDAVLDLYLKPFDALVSADRLVVGVTRCIPVGPPGRLRWTDALERRGARVPVLEADPRVRRDVELLVRSLLIEDGGAR